ncbi:MAG: hypothetical protein HYT15_04420 [Candidatus Magasanikbacteria bacterium]|nr:hypothetical protein [Candidatus Magasanikbacteria bacterium]
MLLSKDKILPSLKTEYSHWRLIYILIFGLLASAVALTYYFIYQNVYSAIANANAIISLQSSLNIYNLDIPAFEKATAAIEKKQKIGGFPSNSRNIFYYNSSTSTYGNSSTSR